MLFFLEVIDQCSALFMCPCRPVEHRTNSEKRPRKSCSLINTNMQNVYSIMNMLGSEHVCPAPHCCYKSEANTPKSMSSLLERVGGREQGWQMCYIMQEEAGRRTTCQDTDVGVSLTIAPTDMFQPTGLIVFVWLMSLCWSGIMQGSSPPLPLS